MKMIKQQALQRTSQIVRLLVFGVLVSVIGIASYGLIAHGVWWISLGDGSFETLWHQYPQAHSSLVILGLPIVLAKLLSLYWLFALLREFSQGQFFSDISLKHIHWLAWMTVFSELYGIVWPILASQVLAVPSTEINIAPLSLISVLCLPVLAHFFSAARELDEENKEII
jgi:hypothetical protein